MRGCFNALCCVGQPIAAEASGVDELDGHNSETMTRMGRLAGLDGARPVFIVPVLRPVKATMRTK